VLPPHQGRWWKEKCRQIIITPLVTRANAGTHEFLFTLGTGSLDRGAVRSEKRVCSFFYGVLAVFMTKRNKSKCPFRTAGLSQ